jgi:hypothetical protein
LITKNLILKKLAYKTLGNLKIRTQKLDDILRLTSSRSGSTWLNESLQDTKEFKLYNQPFDRVFNDSVYDDLLPSNKNNPFFSNLNTKEVNQLINYWFQIIDGEINPNTDWRFYLKSFNFYYKRKLIKSFFTKDIIEHYVSQPNLKIIYLTRNPVHRAISNMNYGYKDFGDILLKNKILIKSSAINTEKLAKIYTKTNSILTKHVIAWYLENFIISAFLNNNSKHDIFELKYEDMVSNKSTEEKLSHFVFGHSNFELSKKASKTSQAKITKIKFMINLEEMNEIKSCLPKFMPYINVLVD